MAQRDGEMGLADTAGPEQHDVVCPLDEAERGHFQDLRLRYAKLAENYAYIDVYRAAARVFAEDLDKVIANLKPVTNP